MTEEIKKILDRLERIDHKTYSCGFEFADSGSFDEDCRCFEERKKLANYITNSQKENKDLKESNHNWQRKLSDYKQRNEKAIENAKEKIKRYESYIHDLKNGNYPSPTVRQERQELIFRIREQEDLLNTLQGGDE